MPARPVVTNVGAARVDLTWTPPGDAFQQLAVTGYKVMWFQPEFRTRVSNLTVGKCTFSSLMLTECILTLCTHYYYIYCTIQAT